MSEQRSRPSQITIYDVAREAGVSAATVSRVLSGRDGVADATRERVLNLSKAMGYRTNALARDLSAGASNMVAVVIPDIANPFFAELVKGVQSAALRQGLTTLICDTGGDPELERTYLDGLVSRQVTYVFVVGLTLDRAAVRGYEAAGVEFVALDRPMRHGSSMLVRSDNRAGARLAVQHLLDLGHRRIAHICGPARVAQSRHRYRGYQDALEAAGIPVDPALVVESDFSESGGAEAFAQLTSRGEDFTAVFAADDLIAMGALSEAATSGRRVPQNLSIVGFDDVLRARYTTPPLTTVRQDAVALGQRAVELISSPKANGRRVILPVSLVIRGSTTAPPTRSAPKQRRKAWSE